MAMADGSVRFIKQTINFRVFNALGSRAAVRSSAPTSIEFPVLSPW